MTMGLVYRLLESPGRSFGNDLMNFNNDLLNFKVVSVNGKSLSSCKHECKVSSRRTSNLLLQLNNKSSKGLDGVRVQSSKYAFQPGQSIIDYLPPGKHMIQVVSNPVPKNFSDNIIIWSKEGYQSSLIISGK